MSNVGQKLHLIEGDSQGAVKRSMRDKNNDGHDLQAGYFYTSR